MCRLPRLVSRRERVWVRLTITHNKRSQFDLTHLRVVSDVSNYHQGFFNQDWVQQDMGVRVNFTSNDYSYQAAMFSLTGDEVIQDKAPLENILKNGVSVALVYGDRDYQCNCTCCIIAPISQHQPGNTLLT